MVEATSSIAVRLSCSCSNTTPLPDPRLTKSSATIVIVRLHCVDVEFREQNISNAERSDAYPHRLVLLRPELLELYRESKLQPWLEEQVEKTRAKIEKDSKSVEAELKEAASDAKDGDEKKEETGVAKDDGTSTGPTTSIINADDFILNFNPDAFVERKPSKETGESVKIYDEEDDSTKNVRLASRYLREVVLKEFLIDAGSGTLAVTDGFLLTKVLHRKGINMRYIGLLAEKIEKESNEFDFGTGTSKNEALHSLELLKVSSTPLDACIISSELTAFAHLIAYSPFRDGHSGCKALAESPPSFVGYLRSPLHRLPLPQLPPWCIFERFPRRRNSLPPESGHHSILDFSFTFLPSQRTDQGDRLPLPLHPPRKLDRNGDAQEQDCSRAMPPSRNSARRSRLQLRVVLFRWFDRNCPSQLKQALATSEHRRYPCLEEEEQEEVR